MAKLVQAIKIPHRIVPPLQTSTYKMFRQSSNSSLSSISSSSDAVLAGLPSEVPKRYNLDETSSIASLTSEMSAQTLRSIREQGGVDSLINFVGFGVRFETNLKKFHKKSLKNPEKLCKKRAN